MPLKRRVVSTETRLVDAARDPDIAVGPLPSHVAIIMDGNGRWAAHRNLPRYRGHFAGVRSVRRIVEAAAHLGIDVLTVYAFSIENWRRPHSEVSRLVRLFRHYLRRELPALTTNNIQFRVIGRTEALPLDIQREIDFVVGRTRGNTGMIFEIAFNYSGRAEIIDAARRAIAAGLSPDDLDERCFGDLLYTAGLTDPDLLIRTGGDMRVSNFLLWQIAHTELWVTETFWPEFDRRHLLEAIAVYQRRLDRRDREGIGLVD
jgi:undecaprenyl diphosphate synthase